LIDEAVKTATVIAAMPPMAAMVNKDMVNAAFETTLDQGLIYERRLFQILAAAEAVALQDVLDPSVEALDHAIGLRVGRVPRLGVGDRGRSPWRSAARGRW